MAQIWQLAKWMPTLAPGYQVESRLVEVIAKSCLFVKGCTRQRFRKRLVWKKHLSLLLEEVTVTSFVVVVLICML